MQFWCWEQQTQLKGQDQEIYIFREIYMSMPFLISNWDGLIIYNANGKNNEYREKNNSFILDENQYQNSTLWSTVFDLSTVYLFLQNSKLCFIRLDCNFNLVLDMY